MAPRPRRGACAARAGSLRASTAALLLVLPGLLGVLQSIFPSHLHSTFPSHFQSIFPSHFLSLPGADAYGEPRWELTRPVQAGEEVTLVKFLPCTSCNYSTVLAHCAFVQLVKSMVACGVAVEGRLL